MWWCKGCLANATIESNDVTGSDKDTRYIEFVTFRLTGDKKMLQEIRKDHVGHADVLQVSSGRICRGPVRPEG